MVLQLHIAFHAFIWIRSRHDLITNDEIRHIIQQSA